MEKPSDATRRERTSRKYHVKVYDEEGVDRTPKPLYDPKTYIFDKEIHKTQRVGRSHKKMVCDVFQSKIEAKETQTKHKKDVDKKQQTEAKTQEVVDKTQQAETQALQLWEMYKRKPPTPYQTFREFVELHGHAYEAMTTEKVKFKRIKVILTESETMFFLHIQSTAAPEGTEEAERIKERNEQYKQYMESKGKLRKMVDQEIQTFDNIMKSKYTMARPPEKKDAQTSVAPCDIYDTYNKVKGDRGARRKTKHKVDFLKMTHEVQLQRIARLPKFCYAAMVIERYLSSNTFETQQAIFKGILSPEKTSSHKTQLHELWSFHCERASERTVTSLCWNDYDLDTLAVGYGKYYLTEVIDGLVCCWSIMNPRHPMRTYHFEEAVMVVSFSKQCPSLLAVGCYDGRIFIIDASREKKTIVADSGISKSGQYGPIWDLHWYQWENYADDTEHLISISDDGCINRWTLGREFTCFNLHKLKRVSGTIKGIPFITSEEVDELPLLSTYSSPLVVTFHPDGNGVFYVGTDEGVIHMCALYNSEEIRGMFRAHCGPVYSIEFSPFCKYIFATCGADWTIRLWIETVPEPIITLQHSMAAIQKIIWSPMYSTVLATICDDEISIWDIHRKRHVPVSVTKTSDYVQLSSIVFSSEGQNILTGDHEGHVRVYNIQNMPPTPHLQESILLEIIENAVSVKQYPEECLEILSEFARSTIKENT